MTCIELVELVTDYFENTLPEAERARFEAHLKQCPYCVNYVEQMRTVVRTLGKLTPAAVSPEAEATLLAHFRSWARA
jgi:anti-sigma factor RsiW